MQRRKPLQTRPSRRQFLALAGAGTALAVGATGALPGHALASYWRVKERKIAMHNLWTEEYLDLAYWRDGDYLPSALADFDYLLRDRRSGQIGEIFRSVFDQLFWLGRALGSDAPFGVISGFRSDSSNQRLRRHSEGVAKNSLHTYGMAIDVRMEGVADTKIWQTAVELGMGGAGLYRSSEFVHLDVGPVRTWGS
ncbi:MAG: DUF882 domain-containing protein [Rhodospirillaceae bacterium]|nr:DUF882 domain-containing protein [Rhodospirillaceae bacterium]MBT5674843.1 DUF882 domain-containing protein [Rhodospirillaceae bacterium]MBT5779552.1 DUF882 domain-containing protein [Rhodospirillaceae bacterium]